MTARELVSFRVAVRETDLWVSAERALEREVLDLVLMYRYQLEAYIGAHPEFQTSLLPLGDDPCAPPIVREMMRATRDIGIGPMAAVAGAFAEFVGKGLSACSRRVIVENGGDVYLNVDRDATVLIHAGKSPLSERIGLKVRAERMPLGVCSSSATVGHSLSRGRADAVCVLSSSCARADGAATALGNRITSRGDLQKVAAWGGGMEGLDGGVVIFGDALATWGDLELVIP